MKTTLLHKDDEKKLTIEKSRDNKDIVMLHFTNIYGENVTRTFEFSDSYDMSDFTDSVDYYLNLWDFYDNIYEIFDKIDDFLYEVGICY